MEKNLGFVYVIICDDIGIAKVGFSQDPFRRLNAIKGNNPSAELALFFAGTREVETILHRQYRRSRVSGEWFKFRGQRLEEFCAHTVKLLETALDFNSKLGWINPRLLNGVSTQT